MSSVFGALQRVNLGFAQTFEHPASNFAFRVEGDGRVENRLLDQFQPSDNIAESLNDRRLRQYLIAESAFAQPENAVADRKTGEARLKQTALETLGKGWEVDEFYPRGNGTASRTVVSYRSAEGATQKIDIEHRSREDSLTLRTSSQFAQWSVDHSIDVELQHGQIVSETVVEHAGFQSGAPTRYL